ncbi:MAG: S-layer homology domain-containing protein [Clostridiales bacterium]|nr:S-layer homology domain-containing protein [Clostridiales bacterium]
MKKIILKAVVLAFTVMCLGAAVSCSKAVGDAEAVYDYPDEIVFDNDRVNTVIIGGSTACVYEEDDSFIIKKCGWSEFYGNYETNSNIINLSVRGKTLSDFTAADCINKLSENLKAWDEILLQIELEDYKNTSLIDDISKIISLAEAKGSSLFIILPYYTYSENSAEYKMAEDITELAEAHNITAIYLNFISLIKQNHSDNIVYAYKKDKKAGYDCEGFNEISADMAAGTIYLYEEKTANNADLNMNIFEFNGQLQSKLSIKITRGMFVDSLVKLCGFKAEGGEGFADVSAESEYYESLLTAKSLGLIGGYSDGTFRPDEVISLSDVCVIGLNFINKTDAKYDENNNESESIEGLKEIGDAELYGVETYAVSAAGELTFIYNIYLGDGETMKVPLNSTILGFYTFFYDNVYEG